MNIALCCYSSTGDTRWTCRYIAHNINSAQFDLMDVVKSGAAQMCLT